MGGPCSAAAKKEEDVAGLPLENGAVLGVKVMCVRRQYTPLRRNTGPFLNRCLKRRRPRATRYERLRWGDTVITCFLGRWCEAVVKLLVLLLVLT